MALAEGAGEGGEGRDEVGCEGGGLGGKHGGWLVWEGRAVVVVETDVLSWELGGSLAMAEMQGGTLVWRAIYVSA